MSDVHRPEREIVRAPGPKRDPVVVSPAASDLYEHAPYGEALLRSLLHAQLAATLSVLAPAAALLAAYPLVAALVPRVARLVVGGVPLTLLVLGGGFYPILVALGFAYVRRTERTERRFADLLRDQ